MGDLNDQLLSIALTQAWGRGPTRARLVAVRPLPHMDEQAFEIAVGAFHRAYAHASQGCRDESELQEATREALEAFLGAYEECRV